MKSRVFIGICAVLLTAECFAQQTPQRSQQQEVEAVVTKLYKQILLRKPDGLPQKKDLEAIRPFLSQELLERIRVTTACEKDFFRQYPYNPAEPMKPPFSWMETGLFSGSSEKTSPSWFSVHRAVKQKNGSYEVGVKLKERENWGDAQHPNRDDLTWEVVVFVIRDGNHYAINDVYFPQVHPDDGEGYYPDAEKIRLSELLDSGCKDGKWVGYPDEQ